MDQPVSQKEKARLHVSLALPNGGSLDEEDIALIETVQKCRSILGASKLMGISYRKTWLMTDALNRTFETRVIDTFPGRRGGGAEVTPFGERIVAVFRSVERRSARAATATLEELTSSLDWAFETATSGAAREETQDLRSSA
ncbi:putative transcriptional regulator, ModE family [Rhodomicrobium vannielii ATCC 17100]|jgi:molybdate transport system regulatory protein|uniref:Putative transcriptional regulator, ModE family n=1 Tax=Rhodomicrobium vannielii (strain ATCC 17100 / DSM 162 / LMG 4299 / NCIMB 10020 / ATH 3.1.1) TaxID=648757 RepID=E3I616_RHOVT|nr:LysR family transcriptional regulator [Rhodomicrobium vannielii]ADP70609.1 putative transcriptional regulator, ModE family [Rhodomicrobium vannielii ATCC 17100]MBJ7534189.1 ModE family transcriptional regulator [Rhodomicrobium vannielii ATCC 17100]